MSYTHFRRNVYYLIVWMSTDYNAIQTLNHLFHKQILIHLVKLPEYWNVLW